MEEGTQIIWIHPVVNPKPFPNLLPRLTLSVSSRNNKGYRDPTPWNDSLFTLRVLLLLEEVWFVTLMAFWTEAVVLTVVQELFNT